MSHSLDYIVVEKRSQIMPAAEEYAFTHIDREENYSGSYHSDMHILDDNPVFKDYEAAYEYIHNRSKDEFYQDYAVRFHDTDALKPSKKVQNLEQKRSATSKKMMEYTESHSVKSQKAKKIGCKNCESAIAKDYLRSERCPVCGADLRAEYILERLKKYQKDIAGIDSDIRKEKQKAFEKAPVKWLVKVEVHC